MHTAQENILNYLKTKPDATLANIGYSVGIPNRALVSYHINKLIADGYLKKLNKYKVLKKEA